MGAHLVCPAGNELVQSSHHSLVVKAVGLFKFEDILEGGGPGGRAGFLRGHQAVTLTRCIALVRGGTLVTLIILARRRNVNR